MTFDADTKAPNAAFFVKYYPEGGGKRYGVCVTRYAVRPRPELEFDAKAHVNEDLSGSTIESILSPPGLSLYPPWPLG